MSRKETFFYVLEKLQCMFLVLVLTPAFFAFMMSVVRTTLVYAWDMGIYKHMCHVILSVYLFINVLTNMIMCIFTDTSLKSMPIRWIKYDFCDQCKTYRPKKTWHCKKCNVCVLKRDHHCYMFSSCIGFYNQRYYITYLFYLVVSMVYATLYSYYFVDEKLGQSDMIVSIMRLVNPFLRYYLRGPWSENELYAAFFLINLAILLFAMGMFFFHFRNVIKGTTARESSQVKGLLHPKWKENFVNVFGVKWYWALVWPFVESPLPENMFYETDVKQQ